ADEAWHGVLAHEPGVPSGHEGQSASGDHRTSDNPSGVCVTIGPAGTRAGEYWRDIELVLDLEAPSVQIETITSCAQAEAAIDAWRDVAAGAPAACILSLSIDPAAGADAWRWA